MKRFNLVCILFAILVCILFVISGCGSSSPASSNGGVISPAAPTGLIATASSTQITLSWTAVSGATSYNIYGGDAVASTTVSAINKIASAGTTTFTQSGLFNGTKYYYVVTAVNTTGESVPSSVASAATAWRSQTSGTTNTLWSIAWNGTKLVAVGASGTVITSPDAITWTPQTSNTINTLRSIIWNGAKFIAVGDGGTIITSPDGIAWTPQTSGTTNTLWSIAWNGSKFVIAGGGGTTLTSSDAVTWIVQTGQPIFFQGTIIWDGTKFVAVHGLLGNSSILTSPNGITWTDWMPSPARNDRLYGIAYDGAKFVAVGFFSSIYMTSDFITWNFPSSVGNMPAAGELFSVIWNGAKFVAVGNTGITTSPDGNIWTPQTSGTTNWLYSVIWDGTKFITVGMNGTIITSQ